MGRIGGTGCMGATGWIGRITRVFPVLPLLPFLPIQPVFAQSPNTAALVVIVVDQTGAVIPGARVTIVNTGLANLDPARMVQFQVRFNF